MNESKKQWSDMTIEEKVEDLKDSVNRLFDYTAKLNDKQPMKAVINYTMPTCDHEFSFSHNIEPNCNITNPQRQSVYICKKCCEQRIVNNYI